MTTNFKDTRTMHMSNIHRNFHLKIVGEKEKSKTSIGNSYDALWKASSQRLFALFVFTLVAGVTAQILIERERVQASELVEIQFFHLEAMENIV